MTSLFRSVTGRGGSKTVSVAKASLAANVELDKLPDDEFIVKIGDMLLYEGVQVKAIRGALMKAIEWRQALTFAVAFIRAGNNPQRLLKSKDVEFGGTLRDVLVAMNFKATTARDPTAVTLSRFAQACLPIVVAAMNILASKGQIVAQFQTTTPPKHQNLALSGLIFGVPEFADGQDYLDQMGLILTRAGRADLKDKKDEDIKAINKNFAKAAWNGISNDEDYKQIKWSEISISIAKQWFETMKLKYGSEASV
jgi:hypothetical protein